MACVFHRWKKEVALAGLILSWMRKTWKMEAKFQGHLKPDDISNQNDDGEGNIIDGDVDDVTLKKNN